MALNFFKKIGSELLDDQENWTDLTNVSVADADACMSVLSKRYANKDIYTSCGPLLVALPQPQASACVEALHGRGWSEAAVIAQVQRSQA